MKPGRGIVPGSKKKALPKAAAMAFADFDDAEEKGNQEVAKIFKRTAKDWQAWLAAKHEQREPFLRDTYAHIAKVFAEVASILGREHEMIYRRPGVRGNSDAPVISVVLDVSGSMNMPPSGSITF